MTMYHRIYAEIDLDAIRSNILNVRKHTESRVMAVVKADAYGHGADRVASEIEDIVDYFAVATIEEAVRLRKNKIKKPILILGYLSPEYFEDLVKYDIEQTIFDEESARLLAKVNGKAHLAIDTGMGRIGFEATEEGIERIKSIKGLNIAGIFTHFASADEADKSFTLKQYEKFMYVCQRLEDEGIKLPLKHAANSAAIIDMPFMKLDMVRSGIITYGLMPSSEVGHFDLKPAMKLISHVVHVKTVPAGTPISYGRTFVTERESVIATIPVGYADGYPRALSNKGRVIINGRSAPIAGRVCMDQFMVDVTDIGEVKRGDVVYLMNETVTADEIASIEGTINYETVCKVSARVPRIYK